MFLRSVYFANYFFYTWRLARCCNYYVSFLDSFPIIGNSM